MIGVLGLARQDEQRAGGGRGGDQHGRPRPVDPEDPLQQGAADPRAAERPDQDGPCRAREHGPIVPGTPEPAQRPKVDPGPRPQVSWHPPAALQRDAGTQFDPDCVRAFATPDLDAGATTGPRVPLLDREPLSRRA